MKFNRKHLTTLLATLLLATVSHSALGSFFVDSIKYVAISDSTVVVTYTQEHTYVDYYGMNYSGLTDAVIPDSVTYNGKTYAVIGISNYAFYKCKNLKTVSLPKTLTYISHYAFYNCTGLTNVYIEDLDAWFNIHFDYDQYGMNSSNPLEYAHHLYLNNNEVTELIIPSSVSTIEVGAFYGCKGLTSITIPNTVTSIGKLAFSGCNEIKTLVWDVGNFNHLGAMGTSNIETVTIGNNVHFIPNNFVKNSKITSAIIPNSVDSIGAQAFQNCTNLSNLAIGNSVTSIGSQAFQNCGNLSKLTIPKSVITIGSNAFSGCSNSLERIIVESGNTFYDSRNNCNAIIETATNNIIIGCKNTIIPNTINTIGAYAFQNCTGLTNITIPKSMKSIGNYAFSGCNGLEYVLCLPTNPPRKGNYAFPDNTLIYATSNYYRGWGNHVIYRVAAYSNYEFKTISDFYTECKELSHLMKVKIDDKWHSITNDSILITGLKPGENYSAVVVSQFKGTELTDTLKFETDNLYFESLQGSSTQSTITPKFKVNRADEHGIKISITSCGARYLSKDYAGKIIEETDDYYIIETEPITGLAPNRKIYYYPWVTCNGKKCEGPQYSITTQNIGTSGNATTGPTNVEMTGSYSAGDAHVVDSYFTFNDQQMKKIVMTGLEPSTTYSTVYTVVTRGANGYNTSTNTNMTFNTKSLTMTTKPARMLTDTSPMLIAETNMADVETSCGFEWRRYDAPEEMPSVQVYCPVYGGNMAGVLKNMAPNVYYKYRPFYKSSVGNMYYGDWVAFITADAGVTFDPVVYTYKAPAVTQSSATLQGVALPGSSDITEQGFEYWRLTNSAKAPTGTVSKVTATGQRMSATVNGLNAGANYGYRSYVIAGEQTYYGSEEQFTTEKPSGDVNGDGRVNVSDVSALINHILGIATVSSADVNGDGRINVSDVSALINIILGIS